VVLLDQSYSMRGDKGKALQQELSSLLSGLGAGSKFYILGFHSSGFDAMPSTEPLLATRENVQAMLQWSTTTRHVFGSQPFKAAMRAFSLHPQALWIISDGDFSTSAAAQITASNKVERIKINTIDIQNRSGEPLLRDLAEKNGGVYKFTPQPKTNGK